MERTLVEFDAAVSGGGVLGQWDEMTGLWVI